MALPAERVWPTRYIINSIYVCTSLQACSLPGKACCRICLQETSVIKEDPCPSQHPRFPSAVHFTRRITSRQHPFDTEQIFADEWEEAFLNNPTNPENKIFVQRQAVFLFCRRNSRFVFFLHSLSWRMVLSVICVPSPGAGGCHRDTWWGEMGEGGGCEVRIIFTTTLRHCFLLSLGWQLTQMLQKKKKKFP